MKTLNEIMTEHKTLNTIGFGVFGADQTERSKKLYDTRIELRRREEHIREVAEWLVANLPKNQTVNLNTGWSSYGLKHIAETALGGYVSNGELIAAALMAGFPIAKHSLNAQIGVYKPAARKLWKSLGCPV